MTQLNNALWFSRHQPTDVQLKEIESLGFQLVELEMGMKMGAKSLDGEEEAFYALEAIYGQRKEHQARAVFGVFPTPLLGEFVRIPTKQGIYAFSGKPVPKVIPTTPVYAAWNVNRAKEGEKPQFTHKKWVQISTI
jgi:hypothetical protein